MPPKRPHPPPWAPFRLRVGHYNRTIDLPRSDNAPTKNTSKTFSITQEFVLSPQELSLHSTYFTHLTHQTPFHNNLINMENEADLQEMNLWYSFIKNRRLRTHSGKKIGWKTVDDLLDAYFLAEELGATHFMDALMDELLRKFKDEPHREYVELVWASTEKTSLVRKMFVEVVAAGPARCLGMEYADGYPNDFLNVVYDLHFAWRLRWTHPNIFVPDFRLLPSGNRAVGGCRYHDHVRKGLPCYRVAVGPPFEPHDLIAKGLTLRRSSFREVQVRTIVEVGEQDADVEVDVVRRTLMFG